MYSFYTFCRACLYTRQCVSLRAAVCKRGYLNITEMTRRAEQNVKKVFALPRPLCLGLFYDVVLLLEFPPCLLFLSHWSCLNILPDKSNCADFFKKPSETYGANQNHRQRARALESCASDFMAVETQISCSTSEQRTVTFEELDLEIPHDKVEKKEEKIVWYEQRKETRTSDFHL